MMERVGDWNGRVKWRGKEGLREGYREGQLTPKTIWMDHIEIYYGRSFLKYISERNLNGVTK